MNDKHLVLGLGLLLAASAAVAQERQQPLEPPDRSSPRAALQSFLESGDAIGRYLDEEYIPAPGPAKYLQLVSMTRQISQSLDLSQLPPSIQFKTSGEAAMTLYEILNRIELPAWEEVPGPDQVSAATGGSLARWAIPHTEIILVRVEGGTQGYEYLFSPDTVARLGEFYARVRGLPHTREVPFEDMSELYVQGGGWAVPLSWVEAMPGWLRAPLADNAVWKWLALVVLLGAFALALHGVRRISRRVGAEQPVKHALNRLIFPLFLLIATPVVAVLALVQINLLGAPAVAVEMSVTAIIHLSAAWLVWRAAPAIAEFMIASPSIATEGADAYLIRISSRLLGLAVAIILLVTGAEHLGVPVYGIVAGLGIGGLALALATQPTIENLIGSMSLFGDKPVRVGDLCKYGEDVGWVESIGIRSTRIRGFDRSLTTIPNRTLANLPIVNYTQRDRMLIRAVFGVRYETSPEQLRMLLAKLRDMLVAHPRIHPEDIRVNLIGFGSSSLDLELYAYSVTRGWEEHLAIQEDVLLRAMDIVSASGSGFAFPSQTLYFTRDRRLASPVSDGK